MIHADDRIANFELDNVISYQEAGFDPAHTRVPNRYADTADNLEDADWGFQTSGFDVGSAPEYGPGVWREICAAGNFVSYRPVEIGIEYLNTAIDLATGAAGVMADTAVSIWDVTSTTIDTAVRGVNAWVLESVVSPTTVLPMLLGKASSPVQASIDLTVPDGAVFLTFSISVLDPGNGDTLLVAIDEDVIGAIDLTEEVDGGSRQVQLWVGDHAGESATLHFVMPSEQSSSAEFILSDLQFRLLEGEHAPIANPDLRKTNDNTAIVVDVLANDGDIDGDTIAVVALDTTDTRGTVTANGDGTVSYDPAGQFASLPAGETDTDTFTYTISDGQGGTATAMVSIIIEGVVLPPVASAGGPYDVDAGSTVFLDASGTYHPEAASGVSIASYEWDLDNDGQFDDATGVTVAFPTWDDAIFTVGLRVTDGNGYFDLDTTTILARNVPPTIALSGADVLNEGMEYSLTLGAITDPEDDTVTQYIVDWGDGTSQTYTSAGPRTHTYLDDMEHVTIRVALVDEDGTHENAGTLDVMVRNVVPTIAISGAASADEGALYTLALGSITDPGVDTVVAIWVNWGDGTVEPAVSNSALTHVFDDSASDVLIRVDLVDEDGTHSGAGMLPIDVHNVAPSAVFEPPSTVDEGDVFELGLTSPTDPSAADIAAGFQYAFDLGDGYGEFGPARDCRPRDFGRRSLGGGCQDPRQGWWRPRISPAAYRAECCANRLSRRRPGQL